ncbi:U3 small nucleolar RNA-associated protein [Pseudogymnoascus verrucosus]|uniref:U3 small nucleolar RNA-associated protein n=1 Tax=Pseudogymnoascus verrucosus TaxID=342668 RepID=A0A1B8GHD3_9PEZI|nr:U3 small nucleolar RNA-associated protein [Pseudogymnoascus verrucosus]OBT95226.1 U3 small nucleolar RNA-associated protein [Pseudogymnoascus verrucosus]
MDVHRCRFVPYSPSTINAVAFSHSHLGRANKSDTLRLAIGRANGDIEIWNPLNGAWFQETILRGGQDRSVDGLAWVQDPDEEDHDGKIIPGKLRLFSIGYTTTVTEWDLERLQPLRQSSGNHGEIWCLAAQPQLAPGQQQENGAWNGQNLITGCTDGALVLYSTADDDLKLQRVLVRPSAKKAKIISVNFQDRNIVVAGCTDSTIRVYDSRNGSSIRSISLGSGPSGGPKEIIVWAVKCLPNGNIVSGDSTGELRIWDGKTYTLIQRIKSHRQDILSLAASADGSTVFSGGMDRRTVVYKQSGGPKSRWAEVSHKRLHNHDVKTMTSFEGRGMSFVVSGGPDATPIVLPLREFGAENQRMLPYLPQEPIVQSVPAKRLLMSWWDREVHIWRVSKLTQANDNAESDSESEERHRSRKLVAKVIIKGEANINSASVAAHGGLLALSTNSEVKLFQLRSRGGNQGDALRVSKLDLSEKLSRGGARLVQFSPDGQWLVIVRRDNRIVATRIVGDVAKSPSTVRVLPSPAKLSRLDRKVDKATRFGGLGDYERNINRIAFSSDSRILAVSDLAGYIDTWLLKDDGDQNGADSDDIAESDASPESSSDESDSEDATKSITLKGQSWTRNPSTSSLPKLPAAAVVLSFRPCAASIAPETEDRMLVVTATSAVFEFEAKSGKLTPWSRSNPTTKFPDEFKGLRDQAMGCFWDVADSKERLWLYGSKWMFMFDLSRDFPPETEANAQRKRKHMHIAGQDNPRKGTSGAGSKIPDEQLTSGMSRKMQRVNHEDDSSKPREINLRNHVGILDDDEDDEEDRMDYGKGSDEAGGGAQGKLRRGGDVEGGAQAGELTEYGDEEGSSEHPPHWWHTYKYRPIMGIVSLGGGGGEAPASSSGLEIALVERPEWELELPPRYYGDQEWEKRGL